jgi:dTDP-4-amino-4,6-dideoxygalactose transaminase
MTDVQAAIGLVQLGKLDEMVRRRRDLAACYQATLADVPGLRTVRDPAWGQSNFQSFWVEVGTDYPLSRNELLAALADQGVSARAGIMAAHRQPAYAGRPHGDLSVTERLTDNTLILPLFHELTEAEQQTVVGVVRRAAGMRAV